MAEEEKEESETASLEEEINLLREDTTTDTTPTTNGVTEGKNEGVVVENLRRQKLMTYLSNII